MSVTLSVATSNDGYIDDCNGERLLLSTSEDWESVYALRSACDAIVIGGETLRRDNPRLSLKRQELRCERLAKGLTAEPHRVIISGKGEISPSLRMFDGNGAPIIIFSNIERGEISQLAEVIVSDNITAAYIVDQLERRGLSNIFVEGGAKILEMFLREDMADTLRLAINPTIEVNDKNAPHFAPSTIEVAPTVEQLGAMRVETYHLHPFDEQKDREYLMRAIERSRHCTPSPTCYCVGAVIVTAEGEVFDGYTTETAPTHHAEQAAILKAQKAGANLKGATIYSSMEPCSQRSSEKESCSQIIIRLGFARAVFALYEPSHFVVCQGTMNMRKAGIVVSVISDMAHIVKQINHHILTH